MCFQTRKIVKEGSIGQDPNSPDDSAHLKHESFVTRCTSLTSLSCSIQKLNQPQKQILPCSANCEWFPALMDKAFFCMFNFTSERENRKF